MADAGQAKEHEPIFSTFDVIVIGLGLLILDILDFFQFGIPLGDVVSWGIQWIEYKKGTTGMIQAVVAGVELIPGVDWLPVRTVAFGVIVWGDRYPDSWAAKFVKVAQETAAFKGKGGGAQAAEAGVAKEATAEAEAAAKAAEEASVEAAAGGASGARAGGMEGGGGEGGDRREGGSRRGEGGDAGEEREAGRSRMDMEIEGEGGGGAEGGSPGGGPMDEQGGDEEDQGGSDLDLPAEVTGHYIEQLIRTTMTPEEIMASIVRSPAEERLLRRERARRKRAQAARTALPPRPPHEEGYNKEIDLRN